MRSITLSLLAALLLVASAAAAAQLHPHPAAVDYEPPGGGDPNPPPGCQGVAATVQVRDNTFAPATLTVQPGQPVCWTWAAANVAPHNVRANDGAFGSGPPKTTGTFQRTFSAPGTYRYHCQVHGSPSSGMRGTVVVEEPTGGGGPPGELRFSRRRVSVDESAGEVALAVERSGGAAGAVEVRFASADGTAGGQDYDPASGTLVWPDGDDTRQSFAVTIADDSLVEGDETFTVSLSNPEGGATLGDPITATVTIRDDDAASGPGQPPSRPQGLRVAESGPSSIALAWNGVADAASYRIERKPPGGGFVFLASATGPQHSDPLPGGGVFVYRVRAENAAGTSPYSDEVLAATDVAPASCVTSATRLCLNGGRFAAEVDYDAGELAGAAQAIPLPAAPDSGLFYFFSPSNVEMLLKVLAACVPPFDRYWVFYAATTNVELTLTVTDTQTGKRRVYFNPLGTSAPPVQDVVAFATCP